MDKELELEAERVVRATYGIDIGTAYSIQKEWYIAGATTSKYVQRQKIKFAIEQLKEIKNYYTLLTIGMLDKKIKQLEQKLSEL